MASKVLGLQLSLRLDLGADLLQWGFLRVKSFDVMRLIKTGLQIINYCFAASTDLKPN